MNLITLDTVSKTLSDSPLFQNASLGIDLGERIGFVGRNGRGKTTFLRVLEGSLEADSGTVARKRGLTLSVLEQRPRFSPDNRLADFLYLGTATLIQECSRQPQDWDPRLELQRAYTSLCSELGLVDPEAPMRSMSGGMVKKAAIARALAPRAELLLLDEPTNHLDIETIEWLEKRLDSYKGAFVLVTHDRWFLDTVCDSIMEIDRSQIYKYPGSFSDYLERRIERAQTRENTENRRLANLKIELVWLMRGARARAGKSERRKEKIRAMQNEGLEQEAVLAGFTSTARRLGKKILVLKDLAKSYGARPVLAPYSRDFKAGERIGLIGPNGSGKSTFLDLVAGRIDPSSGIIERGENTHFAYFDQSASTIDMNLSVIGYIRQKAERISMADGSTLSPEQFLERFLFPRTMQEQSLSRLSGGELRRLQLARILADSPNFLLLDEPTNDLDIDTIELLEDYLKDFPGCVLAVSHDRAFLDGLADSLIVLDGRGGAREFVGRYADYREFFDEASGGDSKSESSSGKKPVDPSPDRSGKERTRKGLSFAEKREYDGLLEEISALEEEKTRLEGLFASSSPKPEELVQANRRYPQLESLIAEKTARWEELGALDI